MRYRILSVFAVMGLVSAAAAGCAEIPQAEVDAATAAVAQAEMAGAPEYAQLAFQAVQDAQTALDAELAAQAEKSSFTRSYSKASELAVAVNAAAAGAATDAAAGREAARIEATTLIAGTKTALTDAEAVLSQAPRGKGTEQDLAALTADLQLAGAAIVEAEAAFASESFRDARAKAEAARSAVAGVVAAVEQASAARR